MLAAEISILYRPFCRYKDCVWRKGNLLASAKHLLDSSAKLQKHKNVRVCACVSNRRRENERKRTRLDEKYPPRIILILWKYKNKK